MVESSDITALLVSWRQGDAEALDRLLPLVRTELNKIARRHLAREWKNRTVQPSSLLQETFLRLVPDRQPSWQDRAHFFAVASTVMRHVLVDHARSRGRAKRGGDPERLSLDVGVHLSREQLDDVVAIDIALARLAEHDLGKSQIFEMRFFGGLTIEETAEALRISDRTVVRGWRLARAWLRRELAERGDRV